MKYFNPYDKFVIFIIINIIVVLLLINILIIAAGFTILLSREVIPLCRELH